MTPTAFYILSGDLYIAEARQSAASVARHMPYLKRVLFTPDKGIEKGPEFDHIYKLPPRIHNLWYLDSLRYLKLALSQLPDYLIWLDSDTYCCYPFGEMIDMLDRFDLLGVHSPGRRTGPTVGIVPECFPELNIGVNGLHNTERLQDFVASWCARHAAHADIYGDNDQNSLRESLWLAGKDALSFYILPPEWNLRLVSNEGFFLRDVVRFLHGRSPDMEALAVSVNSRERMRLWKPE